MLRIHFSGADVARVRIAAAPDPLRELAFSLCRLRRGAAPASPSPTVAGRGRPGLLLRLVAGDRIPGFLVPPESAGGLEAGLAAVLGSFGRPMRWSFPVLEVRSGTGPDLHLRGRGLLLQPVCLGAGLPHPAPVGGQPPVLGYPVEYDPPAAADGRLSLEALIGTTRSYVLAAIGTGATTSELARQIGVSAGTVSERLLHLVYQRSTLLAPHQRVAGQGRLLFRS